MSEKIAKRFAIKSAGSIHKGAACLLFCTEINPDYKIHFDFYNRGSNKKFLIIKTYCKQIWKK